MNYFDKLNLKTPDVFKMAGIGLVAIIVVTFILRLLVPSFSSLLPRNHLVQTAPATSPSYAYDMAQTSGKMGIDAYRASEPELSIRNISPIVPPTGGGAGNAAEEFEAKNYYGTIETRDLRST